MVWTVEETERVGRIETKVDDTYHAVQRIDQALRGWEGSGGLLREVESLRIAKAELQAEIQKLKDADIERRAAMRLAGAAAGAAAAIAVSVVQALLLRAFS